MAHGHNRHPYPAAPSPPAQQDFFRTAPGFALPDGVADTTDNIRRDGLVGLNVDPVSNMDVGGSFGANWANTALATFTMPNTIFSIRLTSPTAQSVNLPPAVGASRRIIVVRNDIAIAKTLNTYNNEFGTASTVIAGHETLTVQSDGAVWWLLNRSNPFPLVVARATINLGDPTPTGARTVTDSFNVASATGLDGSTTVSRVSVVFTTPLAAGITYQVSGALEGAAAFAANNTSVFWQVVSKSNTGFVFATRETLALAQNLNFSFACMRYS